MTHNAEKDARLDAASMEDFRAVAAEAVVLRKGIEALVEDYSLAESRVHNAPGGSYEAGLRDVYDEVEHALADLLTRVTPPGAGQP